MKFDLGEMAMKCCFVQYQPRKFAAAVIRLSDPQTTCLLFESGKAVCTGAGSEQLSCMACLRFVSLIQNNGYPDACFRCFSIQNIVAAVYCPFQLELFRLSDTVSGFCSYEPTLFPGLVYRVPTTSNEPRHSPGHDITRTLDLDVSRFENTENNSNRNKKSRQTIASSSNEIVFVCFQSGKCIITGAKKRQSIIDTWSEFYTDVLLSYAAKSDTGSSARCNIFDTATSIAYEDDPFLFISSITGSATGVIQAVVPAATSIDMDKFDLFDSLENARLRVDILQLQGIDIDIALEQAGDKISLHDATDIEAMRLVRDVKKADVLPFDRWILPEIQNAKRLRQQVMQLGMPLGA
jgi:TATA-box binding protein (TBP) (component of TFIID and TFIIIB)